MNKKQIKTKQVKQSNLGHRNSSSIEDKFNQFKEQHPHCENWVYEEVYRMLVSERENINKRIKRAKSFARTNNSITYNMKKKENNNKYTLILKSGANEKTINYGDLHIAKNEASMYLCSNEYDTIILVDNKTNKGIHFDPLTDLIPFARDIIMSDYRDKLITFFETNDDDKEFYGFSDVHSESFWDIAAYTEDMPYYVFMLFAQDFFNQLYTENETTDYKIHGLGKIDERTFGVELDEDDEDEIEFTFYEK